LNSLLINSFKIKTPPEKDGGLFLYVED